MSQRDDNLLPGWWWHSVRIIAAAPSKLYPEGVFSYPDGPWSYSNTHTSKVHWHWFSSTVQKLFLSPVGKKHFLWPFLHVEKQFLLTIQVSCLYSVWSILLQEWLQDIHLWDDRQHCLSIGLCTAAAAQGSLQACPNSLEGSCHSWSSASQWIQ